MTTADSLFLDTNVLIYATNTASPWHALARDSIEQARRGGRLLVVSTQVLREYLAAGTRPGTIPAPRSAILAAVEVFRQSFTVVDDSQAIFAILCTIVQSVPVGGKQVHDANIVATMQHAGVRTLLTNNVSDFMRFSHLITIVPLVSTT